VQFEEVQEEGEKGSGDGKVKGNHRLLARCVNLCRYSFSVLLGLVYTTFCGPSLIQASLFCASIIHHHRTFFSSKIHEPVNLLYSESLPKLSMPLLYPAITSLPPFFFCSPPLTLSYLPLLSLPPPLLSVLAATSLSA